MKDVSLNRIKFKVITLIISIVVLIYIRTIDRFSFKIFKGPYINILIIIALFVIIISVGLIIYRDNINERWHRFSYNVLDFTQSLTFAVVLVQSIFLFWFFPATVEGISMMPNLHHEDRLIIKVGNKDISRFDVVIIDTTDLPEVNPEDHLIIKRVIGLPGENFYYQDGKLYVENNGAYILVNEPFLLDDNQEFLKGAIKGAKYDTFTPNFTLENVCKIKDDICTFEGGIKIPDDYFFVLGDNRNGYSSDSRIFGIVHRSQIIGQAKFNKKSLINWEKIK